MSEINFNGGMLKLFCYLFSKNLAVLYSGSSSLLENGLAYIFCLLFFIYVDLGTIFIPNNYF